MKRWRVVTQGETALSFYERKIFEVQLQITKFEFESKKSFRICNSFDF
jgi:hypothetical protein